MTYSAGMNVTVAIPDDLAKRLRERGPDLARRALEGFALEEYRAERLTAAETQTLLGFDTRDDLDAFLKAHGVFEPYAIADLERELQALRQAGL